MFATNFTNAHNLVKFEWYFETAAITNVLLMIDIYDIIILYIYQ